MGTASRSEEVRKSDRPAPRIGTPLNPSSPHRSGHRSAGLAHRTGSRHSALAPAKPGDYFDAHFDAEEDALVFRRLSGRESWLAVLKDCPVSPDEVPARRRAPARRRKF